MHGFRLVGVGLLALALAACQTSKSANPLSPDVAGPIAGVSITAPKTLEPGIGQTVESDRQPLTFLIENASSTGARPLSLQLQLASDVDFQQVVHQPGTIATGANGRTSYRLTETISTPGTYYWRVRALDGANTGPYSAPAAFTLLEPVVIEPPVPITPQGQIDTVTPAFVLRNGRISGPAGAVVYRVELALVPDDNQVAIVLSSGVGSAGTTTVAAGSPLPNATTVYWRAFATNGSIETPRTTWVVFRTPTAPTGGGGGSGGGGGGGGTGTIGPARSIDINEAAAIIRAVHDGTRANLGSSSSRGSRNAFWASAVAAVHYGHGRYNSKGPDAGWCIKDGGSGRPQSDDVIVRCGSRDAWDLIGGAGGDGYSFHVDYIGRLPGDQNVYPPPRSALPQ